MKNYIRTILWRLGYDLKRRRQPNAPNLIEFLESRQIDLVFDVGANVGQFAVELRETGYHGRIVSFEPVSAAFAILQAKAAGDALWEVHRLGLGDAPGRASINVSLKSVFSSFLEQTAFTKRYYAAEAGLSHTEEVEVVRFDDIFPRFQYKNAFLKIDTQGFERQVLAGATAALKTIKGIQLELPFVHLYAGTWDFSAAVAYMATIGFALSQIRPAGVSPIDPVSVVDVDCIFRRNDEGE